MKYFVQALKQYADFKGRATRTEYWMYYLFYTIFYIVGAFIDGLVGLPVVTAIFTLGLLIPSISIAARRLHDTGRSGWWQLIAFIPVIGVFVLLYFLVQDSREDNRFGPNPKAVAVA